MKRINEVMFSPHWCSFKVIWLKQSQNRRRLCFLLNKGFYILLHVVELGIKIRGSTAGVQSKIWDYLIIPSVKTEPLLFIRPNTGSRIKTCFCRIWKMLLGLFQVHSNQISCVRLRRPPSSSEKQISVTSWGKRKSKLRLKEKWWFWLLGCFDVKTSFNGRLDCVLWTICATYGDKNTFILKS